ncbi:signal peptide peptidase SppA [Pelagibacterium lacus]|uniref:Signal peptide peptidase SppA n=1 Tax=Pelagibacterium lacus TaxID=2282655 RepID=A0A369W848_9HYPH|nr:signal peptide peptidase SppA [Pelagibacterium lacus]RDE09432.1 signal peptide peptidase SppA [Pelagibacterium lacus]
MPNVDDDPVRTIPVARALVRSRGRWRFFAFLALALAVLVAFLRFGPAIAPASQAIARVGISGVISTSAERTALLDRLAEDETVEAVIVEINSPGGTTAGGEELYMSLRRISERKPVVSTIGELGASAAYMAAIGTDRIFARNLSIVGSVGVYVQHIDAQGFFEMIGVDLDKVASGPLKAAPDYDEPLTPEARQPLEDLVQSSFDYFLDLVVERRGLTAQETRQIADGRVFSGLAAHALGLVDAAGGYEDARAWLESEHDIAADLPVFRAWPRDEGFDWVDFILGRAGHAILGDGRTVGLPLDGLVSLWHPSAQ